MKKSGLLALSILIVVLAFVFSIQYVEQAKSKQSGQRSVPSRPHSLESAQSTPAGSHSEHQATLVSADANAVATRPETAPLLEAVLEQPVSIEHGGALRELALAKDELYVRNADGIGRVVSIPPASNASELLGQIEKLQKKTGSAPELILYPPGAARNESTRRIVTRDILIEADSRSAADSLATASGLAFKSAPVYAKGKYIYEAPSSPEALAFFVKTADSASPYVTPLLASKVAKMVMPNDPLVQKQWHLKFQNQLGAVSGTDVNVESVWKYPKTTAFVYSGNATIDLARATTDHIRGGNVTIGIVDDGMEWSHPDLLPNVLRNLQKDWNGKDNDPKPYFSDDNHGTACAGVAAARGNNRIGVSGVAPEANLVGMRLIADAQTDADIAEAMTWYPDSIHIKSNSWGYRPNTLVASGPLTEAALEYAAKFGRQGKGSILTFAAGNYDLQGDRLDYKGINNSIYVIAVGALDSSGKKSDYSNVGAGLMISAPSSGNNTLGIMTTDNKGPKGYNYGIIGADIYGWPDFRGSGDITQNFGGTSSATPVVSGVIALMLQRNPNLGWRDVQEILMRSAVKIDDQFPSGTVNNTATGWIVSDRDAGPNPVSGNATVPFKFNDKYGAGLVDAAAAVALSGNWTNLSQQKSQTLTTNETTPIDVPGFPANTITRNFTFSGTNLRVEHATLELTVNNIPKGDLTITLTSPSGSISTFCEPHSDTTNRFTNWKFMTVRNWGENSNGPWTLTITNNGTTAGSLTNAELAVYGTDPTATDSPTAMAITSTYKIFAGANVTLSATTSNLTANGTVGGLTFSASSNGSATLLGNGTLSSNSTLPVYEYTWNTANFTGNYLVTANATSGSGSSVVTAPIAIQVDPAPIAAWDFDTNTISQVPLAAAVSSIRKYAANFGAGNLTFDGSFSSQIAPNENRWDFQQGEIYSGQGTDINSAGEMLAESLTNKGLVLRGGKNNSAEGKFLVFEFSMAGQGNLTVSYAADALTDGFATHTWSCSTNGADWIGNQTVTPTAGYSTLTANQTALLNNSTTAYLRLRVSGSSAASGQNLIDNIILSATPIPGAGGSDPDVPDPDKAITTTPSASSPASTTGTSSNGPSLSSSPAQPYATIPNTADTLDWKLTANLPHQMLVHAEVVDGARFVNSSGSVLAAFRDQSVSGLADANPAKTSYLLAISSANSQGDEMRLRVYDAETKNIFALQGNVTFAKDTTLGTPTQPLRLRTAYAESEQKIPVKAGWNDFVPGLSPDPATVKAILAGYDASEGDRLVGLSGESTYRSGAWTPPTYEIQQGKTYSLLRGKSSSAEITLRGNATPVATPTPQPKAKPQPPAVGTPAPSSSVTGGGVASAAPAPATQASVRSNKKLKTSKTKPAKTKTALKSKKSR
jgi:subtilisin family serine protease